MYIVKVNVKTQSLDLVWDDIRLQRLSQFFSMYDESLVCELYEALLQIKSGKLPSYGFQLEPFSFTVNEDRARVMYNDGYDKSDDTYVFDEFNEMLTIFCDEFQKAFSIDLREIGENYEPVIDGIIDKELITGDRRMRRFFVGQDG